MPQFMNASINESLRKEQNMKSHNYQNSMEKLILKNKVGESQRISKKEKQYSESLNIKTVWRN